MITIRYALIGLYVLLSLGQVDAQIILDYGNVNDRITIRPQLSSAAVDDVSAVVLYEQGLPNRLIFLDKNADEVNSIDLIGDSTLYAPEVYSNSEFFVLMGYEQPLNFSLDSAFLANREWKIQFYNKEGVLVRERGVQVFPNEIGLLSQSFITGVNVDAVHYRPSTSAGFAGPTNYVQISESTNISPIDQSLSPGISVLSYYNFQADSIIRIELDSTFGGLSSAFVFQDEVYFHSGRVTQPGDQVTFLHRFDPVDSFLESRGVGNLFSTNVLPLYSVGDDDFIYSVKSTPRGVFGQNMGDCLITKLDSDFNVIDSTLLRLNGAPFGPYSILLGSSDYLYITSVDVVDRSPLKFILHKVNKTSLEEVWAVAMPIEDFGFIESLTLLDDESVLVFGSKDLSQSEFMTKVSKIGPNGMFTNLSDHQWNSNSWWVQNPVHGGQLHFFNLIDHQDISTQIYSTDGKLLFSQNLGSSRLQTHIEEGMYILRLFDMKSKRYMGSQKVLFR